MEVGTLVTALDGLQNDAERRVDYNDWLQKFQRSPDAWPVVFQVLSQDSSFSRNLKIFCAQTLRHKIVQDLYQVPQDQRLALKDKVLQLLEANLDLVTVVGSQICVALASLAMQVHDWHSALEEVIGRLSEQRFIPLLLEFLKVLPEEFSLKRHHMMDPTKRQVRAKELIEDNANKVMNFMLERAQFLRDQRDKVLFFEALDPWLHEVQVTDVIQSPILDWITGALVDEDTSETAADCLIALLDEADDIREPSIAPVIDALYTRLIQLRHLREQYAENPELHRQMTRIYARAAENWNQLIAEKPDVFLPLLEAVADCIMVPTADLDVIEFTFPFFDDLRLTLETEHINSNQRRFESTIIMCRPIFEALFDAFAGYLRYPLNENPSATKTIDLFGGNHEETEKFSDFRYDVGDMLKMCSFIVGSDRALIMCADKLDNYLGADGIQYPWQDIEAVLFCVRTIARNVTDTSEVLPRIFDLFPKLPDYEKVYHGALLILGRYSTWASNHPSFIPFELQYLLDGITNQHDDVRRAASHAFMFFCADCARQMTPFVAQLVEIYPTLLGRLDVESLCKVGDGIAQIFNVIDRPNLATALDAIFSPVMQEADTTLNSSPTQEQLDRVGDGIHALGSFVTTTKTTGALDDSSPLTLLVQANHEMLMNVLSRYGEINKKIAEGIVRYYIYAIHNCGLALVPQLQSLLSVVSTLTAKSAFPFLFELGGQIAQRYSERDCAIPDGNIIELISKFSEVQTKAFLQASKPEHRNLHGDGLDTFLETGFQCLDDYLVHYMPHFVFSESFDSSVHLAVKTLCRDESRVFIAVFDYLDDVLRLYMGHAPVADLVVRETVSSKLGHLLKNSGMELISNLFYGYMFDYSWGFEPRADILVDNLCRAFPADVLSWVQSAFDTLPTGSVSEEEKFETVKRIFDLMSRAYFSGLGAIIKNFAKAYRQRSMEPR